MYLTLNTLNELEKHAQPSTQKACAPRKLVIAANEAKTEALEELQDLVSCRSINLPWKRHSSNQSALKLLLDITVLEVEEGPSSRHVSHVSDVRPP
jgi:hypothetical protein